jgi:hypothetical protein
LVIYATVNPKRLNQFTDYSLIGNLSVTAALKHCLELFKIGEIIFAT